MTEDRTRHPPAQPHDALFRVLLEHPGRAATLLRDHLPEPIAERLTGEPPRLIDGTFVDEALRGSQTDRLFEVRLAGDRPLLIYALLEHKSAPDPATPLQLAGYMVSIWKRYAEGDRARLDALPGILPLVFYHGTRRWTVPLSLFDMIADDEALWPWTRSMGYILRDLGKIDPGSLSTDNGVRAGLTALRVAGRGPVGRTVLVDILAGVDGDLEAATLAYIIRVFETGPDALEDALRTAKPDRWEALMGTIAEAWLEQGKAEGLEQGKAEGLAEGRAATLIRLLERRFGSLPREAASRIAAADLEELDTWLDRVLDAATLDAVFESRAAH